MLSPNIRKLASYLMGHKAGLVIVLFSLVTVALSLLSIGYIFRLLVDNGLGRHQTGELNYWIYWVVLLIVIFAVGSFFRSYFINMITEKVISQLKIDTYAHLLKVDLSQFEDLKIGDIVSRLGSDIQDTGKLIINFLSFFIRNSIMFVGALMLMFIQSPKLSMLVIFAIPVLLFPLLMLSRHVRSMTRISLAEQGSIAAIIEENFTGIRAIHAYNQQDNAASRFQDKINSYLKHSSIRLKFRSLFFALAIALIACSIIMVIWVGSIDILKGSMSSGQMISFIYYSIIVGMSAGGIAELFSELQSPLASLDRVMELMKIDKPASLVSKKLSQNYDIDFDSVSFSYPARVDISVLDNMTFHIEHGKFTAIVGSSGCGKSTIMQLLLKFYHHRQGTIKIGGSDINMIDASSIREKIAYVQQEPVIFSGSIRSNILFSKPDTDNAHIEKLAKICGILDFAGQLENGLDTEIGQKGIRISGGQKQRIAVARALLCEPEILLLDEATSAIDSRGERQLIENVGKLLKGKTIISIAHRITSIEDADNILLIDNGKVSASGNHKQLLKSSKIYKSLYDKQLSAQLKSE